MSADPSVSRSLDAVTPSVSTDRDDLTRVLAEFASKHAASLALAAEDPRAPEFAADWNALVAAVSAHTDALAPLLAEARAEALDRVAAELRGVDAERHGAVAAFIEARAEAVREGR